MRTANVLVSTDSHVAKLIEEVLTQSKESIETLLSHIKHHEELQSKYEVLTASLIDKAVSIRKALEKGGSGAFNTAKEVASTAFGKIASSLSMSESEVLSLSKKDKVTKALFENLQAIKQKTISTFKNTRTDYAAFKSKTQALFNNYVSQRTEAVREKMGQVVSTVHEYYERAQDAAEEGREKLHSAIEWFKEQKEKEFSLDLSNFRRVFALRHRTSLSLSGIKNVFNQENAKWLITKIAQVGFIYGIGKGLYKRKDLMWAYIQDKFKEWKDRAVISVRNMLGNMKVKVKQWVARNVNGILDYVKDYLPDSLIEKLRPEIPADYINEEYKHDPDSITFNDVLRNDQSKLNKRNSQQAKPIPNEADVQQAMANAVKNPSEASPSKLSKTLTKDVGGGSLFSLNGAAKMLSIIGSPLSAVTSLTSFLFNSQNRSMKEITKTSQSDMKYASNKMGNTGIGRSFGELNSAFDKIIKAFDSNYKGGVSETDAAGGDMGASRAAYSEVSGIGYNPFGSSVKVRMTSPFGKRRGYYNNGKGGTHKGMDLVAADGNTTGKAVFSPLAGTVTVAREQRGYGQVVYVDHANGLQTRYGHLSQIGVKEGDTIVAGQEVGKAGNSGHSTGPHLHYETRINGVAVSPASVNYTSFGQLSSQNTGVDNDNAQDATVQQTKTNAPALAKASAKGNAADGSAHAESKSAVPKSNYAAVLQSKATKQAKPTSSSTANQTTMQEATHQNRDPLYDESTWQQYKEVAKHEAQKDSAETPAETQPAQPTETRIAYKSPFNTGMSEVVISNYIG